MNRISKLTKEQKDKFHFYVDKWLKIGLSTEECNKDLAESAMAEVYKVAGLPAPQIIIWLDSPQQGAIAAAMLAETKTAGSEVGRVWDQVRDQVVDQVWDQVEAQVWAQARYQVGDQVEAQVGDQVVDQVGGQVGDQVEAQVWDQVVDQVVDQVGDQVVAQVRAQVREQVRDQVWEQVWVQARYQVGGQVGDQVEAQVWAQARYQVGDQVEAQVWGQVRDQVWAQLGDQTSKAGYGSHDSGWLSFYDFFLNEAGIKECEKLVPLINLAKNSGWFWPFKGAVIITRKPTEIHLIDKKLHREDGPAILYRDGFSVYALNGVRVTKQIVETPRETLPAEWVLKEKDAEVRREIVRKIGVERLCVDLKAKSIDKKENYELIVLDLKDGRRRPFLKMKNPSIDAIHIEGVPPEIKTVSQALAWRNGTEKYIKPEVLT